MAERMLFRRSRLREPGIRATVFHINRADENTSRQLAFSDEFLSLASAAGATIVLPTPYNVPRLFELIEQSNMLRQCVDAYVTNTVQTGWEVEASSRGRVIDLSEQMELESFVENANSEEALTDVMEKIIRDREYCGFGFQEIIRDSIGQISLFRHCPALWTRLCSKDPTEIRVSYSVQRGRRVTTVTEYRKFRRYVQIVNGSQVWFKEFGDPRRMDYSNGAFEGQSGFDSSRLATELYHWKKPSNDSYGTPQWIHQLPAILGSREAEEVNMRYFQDNTVPPMMLLVGNGRLTTQSYRELNKLLNEDSIGSAKQNKIMLLEAVGEGDSLDGKNSSIELKVEKLTDARQSDGLFKAYDEGNMAKVRSAFRLPPITVGMSQDVNFATASTSAFVAESQVFAPERVKIDGALNKMFVNGINGMKLATVKLVSRVPSITSPEMLIKTLTALNVMGAVTPRSAQKTANKVLQTELEPYPEKGKEGYEEWMDAPIAFAIKQGAAPDGGTAEHDDQNQKTDKVKDAEATGNVEQDVPKHGQE